MANRGSCSANQRGMRCLLHATGEAGPFRLRGLSRSFIWLSARRVLETGTGAGTGRSRLRASSAPNATVFEVPVQPSRRLRLTEREVSSLLGASTGEVSAVYRRARAVATVSALRSLEMAGTLDAARYRRDVMRGKSAGKSTPAPPAGPGNGEEERDFAGRMQITRAIHAEMEGAGYRLLNSRDLDLVDLLCSDYVGRLLVRVNDSAIDPRPVVALQDADAAAREAELGKVLVFVSGFGEKEEEGRHLLAKLDFLQGEVVRKTWKACKSGVKRLLSWAGQLATSLAPGSTAEVAASAPGPLSAAGRAARTAANAVGASLGLGSLSTLLADPPGLPPADDGGRGAVTPTQTVRRVGLADAFGAVRPFARNRGIWDFLTSKVTLREPTFLEVAVVCWRHPGAGVLTGIQDAVRRRTRSGAGADDRGEPELYVRLYHDVPVRNWRVVLPSRFLSLRPVDAVRADLVTFLALGGAAASAKWGTPLLEALSIIGAAGALLRAGLTYYRLVTASDRQVLRILHSLTVAAGPASLTHVAHEVGLQQGAQAALVYAAARRLAERGGAAGAVEGVGGRRDGDGVAAGALGGAVEGVGGRRDGDRAAAGPQERNTEVPVFAGDELERADSSRRSGPRATVGDTGVMDEVLRSAMDEVRRPLHAAEPGSGATARAGTSSGGGVDGDCREAGPPPKSAGVRLQQVSETVAGWLERHGVKCDFDAERGAEALSEMGLAVLEVERSRVVGIQLCAGEVTALK